MTSKLAFRADFDQSGGGVNMTYIVGNEATGELPAHIKSTSDGLLNFDRFVGFLAAVEVIEEEQNT